MLYVMQELIRIIDHASPKMWSLIRQTLKGAIDRELKTMSVLIEEVPIQKKKTHCAPTPMCPHTTVCPHTTMYVSAYCYI
jgi:hypothetical protein